MTTMAANAETTYYNTYHHPAADTAAVCTVAANALQTWVLDWILWSYDKVNPTAAETVTVTIGGDTVLIIDIPVGAAGTPQAPQFVPFPKGLYKPAKNEALVVTLSANSGTTTGKMNIGYHYW